MDRVRGSVARLECLSADHAVTLTPRQLAALVAYARAGDLRQAAFALGIRPQTLKNYLTIVYRALDVQTGIDAFRAMGWLQVPEVAA